MSAGEQPPTEPTDEAMLREQAWIGDAVLALYARRWILAHFPSGSDKAALFSRMTSNNFLSAFGEPTKVEARIGRIYAEGGLEAADEWIEHTILPLFLRQNAATGRR
jgi:dsRNA-specific ribonuclease